MDIVDVDDIVDIVDDIVDIVDVDDIVDIDENVDIDYKVDIVDIDDIMWCIASMFCCLLLSSLASAVPIIFLSRWKRFARSFLLSAVVSWSLSMAWFILFQNPENKKAIIQYKATNKAHLLALASIIDSTFWCPNCRSASNLFLDASINPWDELIMTETLQLLKTHSIQVPQAAWLLWVSRLQKR